MERPTYESQPGGTERERITEQAQNTADNLADRAKQAGEKASDIAQQATDKVKQVADDLRSKDPSEIVSDAREKVAEVGAATADRVDSAMTTTGEQMSNLAQTVREKAPEGKAGEVATKAADALERGGEYLQTADLQVVRGDLERVIREHPIEALLVGVGVGYLLARSMRR
jgi:ElaB/YqjD/DUF883 family membrane-anchored ribosome-binding protein